ncbi:hypothetical protein WA556_001902, partial [Blastocystis sp. ATCC 50177/Nand II]
MQPDAYIEPIDYDAMVQTALSMTHKLASVDSSEPVTAAKTINPIAFFNIIQEGDENDHLYVSIVDCRTAKEYEANHLWNAISIPSDTINTPTTTAVVCATLSHMNESWDKDQLLCLYGNSTEEMHICQEFFSKLSPRLHFFLLSDYSAFQAQFPFFTTPALCPHTH